MIHAFTVCYALQTRMSLIEQIIVVPYGPSSLLKDIQTLISSYDLALPVNKSRLSDPPIWD